MHPSLHSHTLRMAALLALLAGGASTAQADAPATVVGSTGTRIVISSRDAAGIGFNDATPIAPVGGNPGTTLGQQRWNVYLHVAKVWADAIQSTVPITVSAGWESLDCTKDSAVLGSAGAWNVWADFPGAPRAGTWYPAALANKLAGMSLTDHYAQPDDGSGYGNVDIKTQFNIDLGNAACLEGSGFYLGLDGAAGSKVNFAATLLHELGHGLGFTLLTTSSGSGSRFLGLPSIWEPFMHDNTQQLRWIDMDDAQRVASAINPMKLAWVGPNAVAAAKQVLGPAPVATVSGRDAAGMAGDLPVGTASFGPQLGVAPVTGQLVQLIDQTSGAGLACEPLSATAAAKVAGKVVLIDRGSCTFVTKVTNVQAAGGIAVLVVDNVVAGLSSLGGSSEAITIPAVRLMKPDGDALKTLLANRSRTRPQLVTVSLWTRPGTMAGADAAGRPLLYTPNPRQPGSSVSHWDVSALPNLLMEPSISSDLTMSVKPPQDLTLPLLKDIGW